MVEVLSPQVRLLIALAEKPQGFTELVNATKLSDSTVGKWLKILRLMGFVERKDTLYTLTQQGREYLRNIFTELTEIAFRLGLVREVKLYATLEELREAEEGYDLTLYAYPHEEGEPARVVVNIADLEELEKIYPKAPGKREEVKEEAKP